MTNKLILSACGETAKFFRNNPDIADELVKAVEKHVASNPEIQKMLERQELKKIQTKPRQQ